MLLVIGRDWQFIHPLKQWQVHVGLITTTISYLHIDLEETTQTLDLPESMMFSHVLFPTVPRDSHILMPSWEAPFDYEARHDASRR